MRKHLTGVIALAILAAPLAAVTAAAPASAVECGDTVVTPTHLAGADFTETRKDGHYEFIAEDAMNDGGLHIWTESNTSTDKVAGYWESDQALDAMLAHEPYIGYEPWFGLEPGMQLVIDGDNDGVTDGLLVGEPTVYGPDWWLTGGSAQYLKDGAPDHGGGFGSENHGTLAQWSTAFPSARVDAVGFSLGSGVFAEGTITFIQAGCLTLRFSVDPPVYVTPTVSATWARTCRHVAVTVKVDPMKPGEVPVPKRVAFQIRRDGTVVTQGLLRPGASATVRNHFRANTRNHVVGVYLKYGGGGRFLFYQQRVVRTTC